MLQVQTRGLVRRFLILFALITCLAFAALRPDAPEARAAICCDQCWTNLDLCLEGCNGSPSCESSCQTTFNNCYRYCNYDC